MLLKLAVQNIRRSKGYFIAYMLTIAVFFTIVYQITNIESQIETYFHTGAQLSEIKLEDAFFYMKYIMYGVVFFFAVYISRFFIKRRSKEVALLKTLGLNRRNIWYMFLIENAIIVLVGLIVGLFIGILTSRLFAILALQLIGFQAQNINFVILNSGILNVIILMGLIYIVISIVPIFTIAKSSIIELLNDQVRNDNYDKKPWVSLLLFIIFTALLIYQAFFHIPNLETFDIMEMLLYFLNAILVAIFLYRGVLIFYFINYRNKQKGISSPVKLLSFNHMAGNIFNVYKMMSFITIVSAVVTVFVITVFGMFNRMEKLVYSNEESIPLKYISTDKKSIDHLNSKVAEIDANYQSYPVYTLGDIEYKYNKEEYSNDVIQKNLLVIKKSDYRKFLESQNINANSNGLIVNEKINCKTNRQNKIYCDFLMSNNLNNYNIHVSEHLDKMATSEFGDQFLKEIKYAKTKEDKESSTLYNRFAVPTIIVLNDNNKAFNSLNKVYFTTLTKKPTQNDLFKYFDVVFDKKIDSQKSIVMINDILIAQMVSIVVIGLFQVMFLMIGIITIIALMMAIFFRTLENLEKGVNEYIIAKRVGLSERQIKLSIFIEAFVSQIFPFLLGIVVSVPLFNQLIAGRLFGNDLIEISMISLISEPVTMMIMIVVFGMLILLLIILLILVNRKINKTKEIRTV